MTTDRRTLLKNAASLVAAGSAPGGLLTLCPSPLHAQAARTTRLWLLPHWWPPEYAAEFKKETGIEVAHTPKEFTEKLQAFGAAQSRQHDLDTTPQRTRATIRRSISTTR